MVLLLIGIILGFAMLSAGGDRRAGELEREAARLAALLELAGEQSLLRAEEWGVRFSRAGYSFLVLDGERWRLVEGDPVLRPRRFPEGVRAALEVEGRPVVLAEEWREDEAIEAGEIEPMVLLLSSGEVTPFRLTLEAAETERAFRVRGEPRGAIAWAAAGAEPGDARPGSSRLPPLPRSPEGW